MIGGTFYFTHVRSDGVALNRLPPGGSARVPHAYAEIVVFVMRHAPVAAMPRPCLA